MPRQIVMPLPATSAKTGFDPIHSSSTGFWPNGGVYAPIGAAASSIVDTNTGAAQANGANISTLGPLASTPYLTSDNKGVQLPDFYAVSNTSPNSTGAFQGAVFWDIVIPAGYDPAYMVCIDYDLTIVATNGQDPLANGALSLGDLYLQMIQGNSGYMSTMANTDWPIGSTRSQVWLAWIATRFNLPYGSAHTHDSGFIDSNRQTALTSHTFGDPQALFTYAAGNHTSVTIQFGSGTVYPAAFGGTKVASHAEIRNVVLTFNCGAAAPAVTSQGHIF